MTGIDVSTFQGNIDWSTAARSVDFVMIKASQGRGQGFGTRHLKHFTDSKFERNIKGAYNAGIPLGVYHFSTAATVDEADREADYFLGVIAPYRDMISLWAAVDVEYSEQIKLGINRAELTAATKQFIRRIAYAGYNQMLYTNPDFIKNWFTPALYKVKFDIWLAHHNVVKPMDVPDLKMWQHTDDGRVSGIKTAVDINEGYFELPEVARKQHYSAGDIYIIKPGDVYSNGKAVPERLIGTAYKVKQVRDDRVLLAGLNSWVKV